MYIHCICQKNIILSLFKIDIKLHHLYFNNLDIPFKKYVIRLHNLISMNYFFTERSLLFFIIVNRQPKTNCWSKRIIRSSRSLMFFKIGVLKNFLTCKGKHQCWSFFSITCRPATLLKEHSCFPVNIKKILRTAFFIEHLRWLFLSNHRQC